MRKPILVRITTAPISLKLLLTGQMKFMKDHGLHVFAMSSDGPEIKEVIETEQCQHIIIPFTRRITPFKDLKALWILFFTIKRIRPDIIHTHTPKAGLIGMMAGILCRVPHRIHTVAGLPLQVSKGVKRVILEIVEKITYACATEIWPNSYSINDFILNKKYTTPQKLKVIGKGSSNGIEIKEYSGGVDEEIQSQIIQKIKYDSKNIYLCFVGRLVHDKGIEELVSAYLTLSKTYKNLKLILVGPLEQELNPIKEDTLKIITEHENIYAVGYSNQVKAYLSLSNYFIFPSHREGFPNVLMQAGLQNLPIIASNIDGVKDIISHNESGLLFEVKNQNELIDCISFAIENPIIMSKFALNLKSTIENNFSRSYVQKEILNHYHRLLGIK